MRILFVLLNGGLQIFSWASAWAVLAKLLISLFDGPAYQGIHTIIIMGFLFGLIAIVGALMGTVAGFQIAFKATSPRGWQWVIIAPILLLPFAITINLLYP